MADFDMAGMQRQAADNVGALTDTERKTAAYNALSQAYGPAIAYSPENAFNASKAAVAQQTIPTQVAQEGASLQQTQANVQGKQLENAQSQTDQNRLGAYRAATALQGSAKPDGSVDPADFDRLITPNASTFGIDPDHLAPLKQMLTAPGGAQHLDTIRQALIGPTKASGGMTQVQNQDGSISLMRTDQYGNPMAPIQLQPGATTAQMTNATAHKETADTTVTMAPKKLAVQQQNANAHSLSAANTANNSVFGPGGNVPQGGAGPRPVAAAGAPATTPSGTPAVGDPNALFNKLPPKGRNQAISSGESIVNAGTQLKNTNTLLDAVDKQISPYTAGTGTLLSKLPGTAATDLKANLSTLKAQGLMAFIQSAKAGGPGGTGGLRLSSEANAAMTLMGNMEQDQSAKQLAFHATLLRQAVNRLYQNQVSGYKQQYGVLPHEAAGTSDPLAAAPPAGWKVLR